MRALVKSKSTPGLWLDDVAVPEVGINDVLEMWIGSSERAKGSDNARLLRNLLTMPGK